MVSPRPSCLSCVSLKLHFWLTISYLSYFPLTVLFYFVGPRSSSSFRNDGDPNFPVPLTYQTFWGSLIDVDLLSRRTVLDSRRPFPVSVRNRLVVLPLVPLFIGQEWPKAESDQFRKIFSHPFPRVTVTNFSEDTVSRPTFSHLSLRLLVFLLYVVYDKWHDNFTKVSTPKGGLDPTFEEPLSLVPNVNQK